MAQFQQQFSTQAQTNNTVTKRLTDAKDTFVADGRDAVQLGVETAAGNAALAVLRTCVIPTSVSLLDRVTGKARMIEKFANSKYGSFAIAAVAHVGVQIFAPNNDKLHKITKLALNAATVTAAANIDFDKYIKQFSDKLLSNDAVAKVIGRDND